MSSFSDTATSEWIASCVLGPYRVVFIVSPSHWRPFASIALCKSGTGQLKCDGTRAETRFRLSAKRTSPFTSAGGRQFSRLLAAKVCESAVVMLDTPCSEVVWRVLATHSVRQFPLHFHFSASPCAITFQLESTSALTALGWTEADGSEELKDWTGRRGRHRKGERLWMSRCFNLHAL